jgi:hypothetical protein
MSPSDQVAIVANAAIAARGHIARLLSQFSFVIGGAGTAKMLWTDAT